MLPSRRRRGRRPIVGAAAPRWRERGPQKGSNGRAAAAKLPDEWRLQLYIEEQKAFFRADVKPSDTVAEIEAALSLWATVPAVLSYRGGAPFHPQATAESLGLFEQRGDVVVSWPDGPPAPLAADASAPRPAATRALVAAESL